MVGVVKLFENAKLDHVLHFGLDLNPAVTGLVVSAALPVRKFHLDAR